MATSKLCILKRRGDRSIWCFQALGFSLCKTLLLPLYFHNNGNYFKYDSYYVYCNHDHINEYKLILISILFVEYELGSTCSRDILDQCADDNAECRVDAFDTYKCLCKPTHYKIGNKCVPSMYNSNISR